MHDARYIVNLVFASLDLFLYELLLVNILLTVAFLKIVLDHLLVLIEVFLLLGHRL